MLNLMILILCRVSNKNVYKRNEIFIDSFKRKNENWWKKKVNALKDGFLILCEILVLFFKFKILRQKNIT